MAEPRVVALVPDLMDRSRLAGVADIVFVSRAADLDGAVAEIAVVDLSRPGAIAAIGRVRAERIVAFGSHVDREVLDAARAAGCDEVLPRSAFFARAAELLA